MPARSIATDGRRGQAWRRLVADILRESDLCAWCGHPGSRAGGHILPVRTHPHLVLVRENVTPIHGVEGCPHCPLVWSRRAKRMVRRNCNSEVGTRVLGVDAIPPASGSRNW